MTRLRGTSLLFALLLCWPGGWGCDGTPDVPVTKGGVGQEIAASRAQASEYTQSLMAKAMVEEVLKGDLDKAAASYLQLSRMAQLPQRARALSMYHVIRIWRQQGHVTKANQLAAQLEREYPTQRDLHRRPDTRPWPQRKMSLTLRKANYLMVLKLLGKVGKARLELRTQDKPKAITIQLRDVPWSEAIRTIVWSVGDEITQVADGYIIQPRRKASPMGNTVDLLKSELPSKLHWLAELARKSGLSLQLRRGDLEIKEKGLGIFPAHGRCRGTQRALEQFLERIKLLPFPVQVRTYEVRELGQGKIEASLFLGLMYVAAAHAPDVGPVSNRPTTRQAAVILHKYLTKESIRSVIRAHKAGVSACFEQHKATLKGLKRLRLIVKMQVAPQGRVSQASLRKDDPRYARLSRCLVDWAKRLVFPQAQQSTMINYPFVFTW